MVGQSCPAGAFSRHQLASRVSTVRGRRDRVDVRRRSLRPLFVRSLRERRSALEPTPQPNYVRAHHRRPDAQRTRSAERRTGQPTSGVPVLGPRHHHHSFGPPRVRRTRLNPDQADYGLWRNPGRCLLRRCGWLVPVLVACARAPDILANPAWAHAERCEFHRVRRGDDPGRTRRRLGDPRIERLDFCSLSPLQRVGLVGLEEEPTNLPGRRYPTRELMGQPGSDPFAHRAQRRCEGHRGATPWVP